MPGLQRCRFWVHLTLLYEGVLPRRAWFFTVPHPCLFLPPLTHPRHTRGQFSTWRAPPRRHARCHPCPTTSTAFVRMSVSTLSHTVLDNSRRLALRFAFAAPCSMTTTTFHALCTKARRPLPPAMPPSSRVRPSTLARLSEQPPRTHGPHGFRPRSIIPLAETSASFTHWTKDFAPSPIATVSKRPHKVGSTTCKSGDHHERDWLCGLGVPSHHPRCHTSKRVPQCSGHQKHLVNKNGAFDPILTAKCNCASLG